MPFETVSERQEFLAYAKTLGEDKFISLTCYCNFEGKRCAIPLKFESYEEKVKVYQIIKDLIKHGKIRGGMCILGESYMTHVPPDAKVDMHELMNMPPQDRPFTSDCLMATFIGPKLHEMFISKLELDKGVRTFSKWEKMEGMAEGLLAGFYDSAIAENN